MDIQEILKTEYSGEFDQLRKNRMVVSYYKYGPAAVNYGEKLIDPLKSAEMCIQKARETGNTEYLVDAANYCMLGFAHPPDGMFFKATDSGESAGKSGISINEINNTL